MMVAVIVNVFEASSRSHDVGEEDRSHAAADTEPDTPYLAACHRSSRPELINRLLFSYLGGIINETTDIVPEMK